MADNSKIEWTDASWNPIRAKNLKTGRVGWHCEHATTGCINCYSESFNMRLGTQLPFKPGHREDIEIFLDEEMLAQPLRWKRPRMIFVCSMTDVFADFVKDEWLDRMFAVMALCPQHTFQVLTKRSERMRAYLDGLKTRHTPDGNMSIDWSVALSAALMRSSVEFLPEYMPRLFRATWPLSNVWLGVSAERQEEADERIPNLLAAPAAIRFVSVEPMLEPIDLTGHLWGRAAPCAECPKDIDCECGLEPRNKIPGEPALDWIIVGGESGRAARPFDMDAAQRMVDDCRRAGVSVFMKQVGARPKHLGYAVHLKHLKGGDPGEWPESLRVREMPPQLNQLGLLI